MTLNIRLGRQRQTHMVDGRDNNLCKNVYCICPGEGGGGATANKKSFYNDYLQNSFEVKLHIRNNGARPLCPRDISPTRQYGNYIKDSYNIIYDFAIQWYKSKW